jgi:hypothetical protein
VDVHPFHEMTSFRSSQMMIISLGDSGFLVS